MICDAAYAQPLSRFLFLKEVIEKIVPSEKIQGSYLDIGCSEGIASMVLSKHFSETVNTDIEKWAIRSGKQNCKNNCINANFIASDALKLPFVDSSFDVITSFSLIEHLNNQNELLHEANRLLRENGIFIMQVPNRSFFVELHTGFPFPAIIPNKFWILYCRYLLKSGEYQVKNLNKHEVTELCNSNFNHTYVLECNYTEDNVPLTFRIIYKLLNKVGILHVFPMGWIAFCTKN